MNFFDTIILDNSIRNYCIVGGSILTVLVIKRFLSRYIASLLYRIVGKIWKTVKKKSFVDLVLEPLEWFVVIVITVFAIDKLNFPSQWTYTLYGHSIEEIVNRFGIGIIIASLTWLIMRMIDFIAIVLEEKASLTKDKNDNQLIVFFRDFLKIFIVIGGLLIIIKACFNQPIGQLLIGLSFVGAAFAFAAKESLENLIASFIIFFDKPFVTGDLLKINEVTGRVEKIGLRSTRIRTGDKTLVTVPNKQMVDSIVDNWSMRTNRRGEIVLKLDVATLAADIRQLVQESKKILATKNELISSFSVFISEFNNSGIHLQAEYFTNKIILDDFNALKEEVNLAMKELLQKLQIVLANPTP